MHPEFPEIWRGLCEMGFFITLQTNATMVEGKMAELLEQYPPRRAKITLYGSNDEVYEAVCRVKLGFTRAHAGIRRLMEMRIPIQLVSTIIRQNEADAQRMALFAYYYHLPWVATGSIKSSLRGAHSEAEEVRVTEKLEEAEKEQIRRRLKEHPVDITRKPCTYCKDYRLGYWILWDGSMRFCSFMNERIFPYETDPSVRPGRHWFSMKRNWTGRRNAKAVRYRKPASNVLRHWLRSVAACIG